MNRRTYLSFSFALATSFAMAVVAVGCSSEGEPTEATESRVSGVPIGEVRGVADISKTLRTRLLDPNDSKTPTFDVSRVAGPVFNLRKQLGVFAVEGTTSTYQGGQPTPLRATLWHQLAGRFAEGIADLCTNPGTKVTFVAYVPDFGGGGNTGGSSTTVPIDAGFTDRGVFRVRESVARTIDAVCTFEGDETAHRRAASALFDMVMGIGGSLAAEKTAYVNRFAADGVSTVAAPPKTRVTNMMIALLLNPHFLLAK